MRTYPECIPCILQASLNAGRLAGAKEEELWMAMRKAAELCGRWERENPPIALGAEVVRVLRESLGQGDPFFSAKREGNAKVLALYPALKAQVKGASDPLEEALRLAAAANALDLGVYQKIDFVQMLERALQSPRGHWELEEFKERLAEVQEILYLADNAGEIVADRILIEELLARGKRVVLAVRGWPILNDVTLADLHEVGLPREVEVITTGSDLPGVFLPFCSPEFRARFEKAELIVSKGMGNFEGLSREEGPIFFVLQAKCFPIAQELGVNVGDLVLADPRGHG